MKLDAKELARFQRTADINEIAMMFGRYVTLMDQMDVMSIHQELFAAEHPQVSIEYDTCGTYVGPEHVRAFMEDFAAKMSDWRIKRGWLDFHDAATPHVLFSADGNRAQAMWSLLSPKAKQATPDAGFTAQRTLTAFWQAGKMHWELIRTDNGWMKQADCVHMPPLQGLKPDRDLDYYNVYNADYGCASGGIEWGPYLPEEL